MENRNPEKLGFYRQKSLIRLMIEDIIKKLVPVPYEELLAKVQLETGLSKSKATEYLEMFHNGKIIDIDFDSRKVTLCPQK